jgi:hypothetical protein
MRMTDAPAIGCVAREVGYVERQRSCRHHRLRPLAQRDAYDDHSI